jgi:hypothetical protein
MAKGHPTRNSEFMKAIRDTHSFFQEGSVRMKNNEPVLPQTAIMERQFIYFVMPENNFILNEETSAF